jgi:tRNA threonylcarbamoyl adenosine modification protein YeaZ
VHVRASRVTIDARRHGEDLAPHIAAALAEAGAAVDDLVAVVAGVGPGPYTGLRVGLVTADALGAALDIPVYPVGTLDALAASAGPGRPLIAATDARRREVYWAAYDANGTRLHGPAVGRPDAVRAWLGGAPGFPDGSVAVGAGAALHAEQIGLPVVGPEYPSVAGLAVLAADRILAAAPGEPLVPLYLRRPDAQQPGSRKPALT